MAKRTFWRDGDVLSIKLRDDLYTLAQMRTSPYMCFFDVRSADGKWSCVKLDDAECLFCILVSDARLKPLIAGKVPPTEAAPATGPMPKLFIKPHLHTGGGHPFRGGDLIEVDDRGETTGRPRVKANLSVEQDPDTIRQYELTNMWVDPEVLRERLIRYFDTGVNWDPHKEKVFPGIKPPAVRQQHSH